MNTICVVWADVALWSDVLHAVLHKTLWLHPITCATSDLVCNVLKPQSPHLQNGIENRIYLVDSSRGSEERIWGRLVGAGINIGAFHVERLTFQAVDWPCVCLTFFLLKLRGPWLGSGQKGTEGKKLRSVENVGYIDLWPVRVTREATQWNWENRQGLAADVLGCPGACQGPCKYHGMEVTGIVYNHSEGGLSSLPWNLHEPFPSLRWCGEWEEHLSGVRIWVW